MTIPLEKPANFTAVDIIVFTDGEGHYLQFPKLTTAQRDVLPAANGMMIYNTTTSRLEAYENGSWGALGGAGSFIDLTDTPSDYVGRGGDVVLVKTTEDGIETQPWPVVGTTINYFLSNNSADIGSYYYLYPTETGDAYSELTSGSLSTGDDQLLWSFVTEAGEPGMDVLALGAYTAALFLEKTGNKDVRVYWKLFKRNTGGTETEILQSAASDYLTDSTSQYVLSGYLNEDQALDTTDRLVLKLYANVSGTGTDVTVKLTMEGDYDSRLTINILSSAFNLDRLSDVTITSPADDEVLAYDSGSGKWINQAGGLKIVDTSHTYTIGAGQDFETLTAAMSALENTVLRETITLQLQAGISETETISPTGMISAGGALIIDLNSYTLTSSAETFTIAVEFSPALFIAIKNGTILNQNNNTQFMILIGNWATANITDVTFAHDQAATSYAVYASGGGRISVKNLIMHAVNTPDYYCRIRNGAMVFEVTPPTLNGATPYSITDGGQYVEDDGIIQSELGTLTPA